MTIVAIRRFGAAALGTVLLTLLAVFPGGAGVDELAQAAGGCPFTVSLVFIALTAGLAIGTPLGLAAHARPKTPLGRMGAAFAGIGPGAPPFLMVALATAATLAVVRPAAHPPALAGCAAAVLGLAVVPACEAARQSRRALATAAERGFALAALSRGDDARRVFLHLLLPVVLASMTGVAVSLAAPMVAGGVVAESLLTLPGTGGVLARATLAGDGHQAAAAAAILSGVALLLRAAGATLAARIDPRRRLI